MDWERKGGWTALEIADLLNRSGLPTRLTIVGSTPRIPDRFLQYVDVRGRLDKSSGGADEIARLMKSSHFLVLPTQAEAYGLVMCEANAFGVPALSTSVGGVPTVIRPDKNGTLFDRDASAEAYAAYILGLFDDYAKYLRLAHSSRDEFETRLNWTVAGTAVRSLLESL